MKTATAPGEAVAVFAAGRSGSTSVYFKNVSCPATRWAPIMPRTK